MEACYEAESVPPVLGPVRRAECLLGPGDLEVQSPRKMVYYDSLFVLM